MSQYPPGPPPNYPPGGQPGGPPPNQPQPGWGQQPPPTQQQPGWGQQPQQPQPQPGWGQPGQPGGPGGYQPGGPGSGGGGGGSGAKILIGVVVVAVLAVGAFFLLSGDDSASASSPTDAVESLFAALNEGDCSGAIELLTEETWSEGGSLSREEALSSCEEEASSGEMTGFGSDVENIELVSEDGDNATVSVTIGGGLGPMEVPVVKEGGDWKVNLAGIGSSAPDDGGSGDLPTDDETGVEPPDGFDPDVTLPEDFDPSDITLPEDFDPSDVDCSILEDPELIEACEAGLEAGVGGG